jgi:hypothetical protein
MSNVIILGREEMYLNLDGKKWNTADRKLTNFNNTIEGNPSFSNEQFCLQRLLVEPKTWPWKKGGRSCFVRNYCLFWAPKVVFVKGFYRVTSKQKENKITSNSFSSICSWV